jgi:hypothetical protein
VHGVELVKGTAPIFYGLPPAPPPGYLDAMETLFPHSHLFAMGGCVIDDKRETDVDFCTLCREAENRWTGRGPQFKWF